MDALELEHMTEAVWIRIWHLEEIHKASFCMCVRLFTMQAQRRSVASELRAALLQAFLGPRLQLLSILVSDLGHAFRKCSPRGDRAEDR